MDAAEPRGNDGPEYRVANNAEHHLDALRHHFLHQYAVDAGIRRVARGGVQHLRISDTHRVVALQVELDRAGIGLVRNVGGVDLERNLAGDFARQGNRLFRSARELLACDRKSIFGECELRFALGQCARLRSEFFVCGNTLSEIGGRADRAQTRQCVAINGNPGSDQFLRRRLRVVGAGADPDHRRRFRAVAHELDTCLDLRARHKREDRRDRVDVRIVDDRVERAAEHRRLAGRERREVARVEDLAAISG